MIIKVIIIINDRELTTENAKSKVKVKPKVKKYLNLQLSSISILRMDKLKVPNIQTICYIKPGIIEVA